MSATRPSPARHREHVSHTCHLRQSSRRPSLQPHSPQAQTARHNPHSHPDALSQGLAEWGEGQQRPRTWEPALTDACPSGDSFARLEPPFPFPRLEVRGPAPASPVCTLQGPPSGGRCHAGWASCPSSSGLHTQQTPSKNGCHHPSTPGSHSLTRLFIQQTSPAMCPAARCRSEVPCPRGHNAL